MCDGRVEAVSACDELLERSPHFRALALAGDLDHQGAAA
jgi:hypothetical protein